MGIMPRRLARAWNSGFQLKANLIILYGIILSIYVICAYPEQSLSADCSGCCLHHDELICIIGGTKSADGANLNQIGLQKGYNICLHYKSSATPDLTRQQIKIATANFNIKEPFIAQFKLTEKLFDITLVDIHLFKLILAKRS